MAADSAPHPDLGDSIEIMRKAHEGQMDKCGRPYYLHPLRAAMRLGHCTMEERHAALLHDVVEDTLVTLENLREMGYGEEVLGLVNLLTRRKPEGESHNQYIERIVTSGNVKALRVKLADVYDNMSPARTRTLPSHERGIRHRFARDAERVETALRKLGDDAHDDRQRGFVNPFALSLSKGERRGPTSASTSSCLPRALPRAFWI